jgi:uncharacterized protein YndB with AHSA1/START domain
VQTEATDTITHEVRIHASPETIFEFFTDPQKMVQWKGRAANLEARVGGEYRVDINDVAIAKGEYLEIDPPRRIVFSWGWMGEGNPVPPGSSRVEITLTPDGDETILRLVHSDLPAGAGQEHSDGWNHFLPRLAMAAAGQDPGSDPMSMKGGM